MSPQVNLNEALEADNVNCITCGGQASIPISRALCETSDVEYIELVPAIASKSAGTGTRNNIDEFTQTTAEALSIFTDGGMTLKQ